jgi:Xaa-Pro aminopeptidase
MWPISTPAAALARRRERLASTFERLARERGSAARGVLLAAEVPRTRSYAGDIYPFRARSHFLYFIERQLEEAALLFDGGRFTLFVRPPDPEDALWHGPRPSLGALSQELGLDVQPIGDIERFVTPIRSSIATLPPIDETTAAWLSRLLDRPIRALSSPRLADGEPDALLADAMVELRLVHDDAALAQLRQAANVTALAHDAGMRATRGATREAEVCAAMLAAMVACGMKEAYRPIVTVRGEVLHNFHHDGTIAPGDLLLADVGAETPEGWSGDVTRVWPVSGRFSPTQRALYEVVRASQQAAIDLAKPGVRYRALHERAARVIVDGLVDLGILRGSPEDLAARGAHALFFPHGVGHLLGHDGHDMEDLGDRAGYAPGRTRSPRFGDRYLRLDRDLLPGMVVTIEPGIYHIPAILDDPAIGGAFVDAVDRKVLSKFADVRGIRIEDDVLITTEAPDILTAEIPKSIEQIEARVAG